MQKRNKSCQNLVNMRRLNFLQAIDGWEKIGFK